MHPSNPESGIRLDSCECDQKFSKSWSGLGLRPKFDSICGKGKINFSKQHNPFDISTFEFSRQPNGSLGRRKFPADHGNFKKKVTLATFLL